MEHDRPSLNEGDEYLPLIFDDENGDPRGNDWAKGFMDGIAIGAESWQPLLEDEDHAAA
ncbi:MAG TPA: UPF0149 family protein [Steroidobacter sp.]|uniref:UPF0149 family protein n=1 Tax=Steroidobacter sp. TaxID=1978227 RepID=UPI002ED7CBE2